MHFRTEIHPEPSPFRIDHTSKILFTGSCFTNNIGQRLKDLGFPVIVNPFGVVYNPLSIKKNIDRLLEGREYTEQDLEYHNELWFSFDHHSSFSGTDRAAVLRQINDSLHEASALLQGADYVLLTFGTAWVYRLLKTGEVVCNCHKVPAREFSRELMSVDGITQACAGLIRAVRKKNPSARFLFTISPVRHWKDGHFGNQVSKASLVLAVKNILDHFNTMTAYFPAYELLIDDLRDYRYYADDLLHPSNQAIEYIWEKFSQTFFSDETSHLNREIAALALAASHRPLSGSTTGHRKFLEIQLRKTLELQHKHPAIDLSRYRIHFENLLKKGSG